MLITMFGVYGGVGGLGSALTAYLVKPAYHDILVDDQRVILEMVTWDVTAPDGCKITPAGDLLNHDGSREISVTAHQMMVWAMEQLNGFAEVSEKREIPTENSGGASSVFHRSRVVQSHKSPARE